MMTVAALFILLIVILFSGFMVWSHETVVKMENIASIRTRSLLVASFVVPKWFAPFVVNAKTFDFGPRRTCVMGFLNGVPVSIGSVKMPCITLSGLCGAVLRKDVPLNEAEKKILNAPILSVKRIRVACRNERGEVVVHPFIHDRSVTTCSAVSPRIIFSILDKDLMCGCEWCNGLEKLVRK